MTAAKKKDPQRDLATIGQSAYCSIVEMVEGLSYELESGDPDEESREKARQAILEDALSVQVRSGWYSPGERDADRSPAEYELLLATGGPAVRIVGKLDANCEPSTARLETQDWYQPWTEYHGVEITRGPRKHELKDVPDQDVLLDYARCFYFGDG